MICVCNLYNAVSNVHTRKYDRGLTYIRRNVLQWLDVTDRVRFRVCVRVFKCLHGMAPDSPDYLSTMCHPVSRFPGRQSPEPSLCESRTARRPTRSLYIVVVRCSSLRACWSISVEHSARSSQEPQSDSTFMRHLKSYLFSQYWFRIERVGCDHINALYKFTISYTIRMEPFA